MKHTDVMIIGSGIAALQLAARLHPEKNVRIITKSKMRTANSYLAQGGIAAAIGEFDDPLKHYQDTLEAGRFHNQESVVHEIIKEAPRLIKQLFEKGCHFDHDDNGRLLLGMEGAHSEKRIVHGGGDATGRNVIEFLISQLGENVQIVEDLFVYELILDELNRTCIGVKAKDSTGKLYRYFANHIIIATGGCGQLYRYTSNAETVTGDGIVMAYLAGAEMIDMEFIQFHPTLLFVNDEPKGLVSEAVRGEGAILITENGKPIMEGVHPLKDLAPRHVVSQTIYDYLKKGEKVFLNITSITDFRKRFPSITNLCEKNGIDLLDGKIPIVPGSHFLMGGIKTDLLGRTSIPRLYAIGEAACTGLHGANRLASNSMLEGLYQGEKLAEWLNEQNVEVVNFKQPKSIFPLKQRYFDLPKIEVLQEKMMDCVGIVRSKATLEAQKAWLDQYKLAKLLDLDQYSIHDITRFYMLIIAELITNAALLRTESRGGHFRSDYPFEDDANWCQKQIVYRRNEGEDEYFKAALAT